MANHHHNDQYSYSDPFTDRPSHQAQGEPGAGFSSFPQTDYHTLPTLSYSTTMTSKKEDGRISTEQSSYVQRGMSRSYSSHSKSASMNKSGGAAAEYYDSAPAASSNFVNSGAGAGDRLSKVDEEYDRDYGHGRHDTSFSYGEHDDGDKMKPFNDASNTSLVNNAAVPGKIGFHDMEYAEPPDRNGNHGKGSSFTKFLASGKYPLGQRIEDKKRGIGRQRYPFVVWALTTVMLGVLIWELVLNSREQGSPISLKPVVNPMLGPSSSALINLGARFPPCMKAVSDVPLTTNLPCMNNTANPPDRACSLETICGFGGFHGQEPKQWFRFITPIFLHAGIIHFLLNMLAQWTLSAQIEREMGSGGFILTYFAAGIFGNVLGGNFSLVGVPSVGASGAIFGTVAVTWVDLFAHWKYHYRPVRRLVFMTIELLIGIAIGYIPYVDNFAHIGGFVMGLLVGTVFYPVISESKRHRFITWGFKIAAIPIAVILFVVLTRNFYTSNPYAACSGCRYLSCFPTASNNHCKGTGLTPFSTPLNN